MKWLNKIFKGSNHRISKGQYLGIFGENKDGHSHSENEDLDHAIALSLYEEELKGANDIGSSSQVDDDEELARALQESLDIASPPRPQASPSYQTSYTYLNGDRICVGCNNEIGNGHFLSCLEAIWHPQCFRCHSCGEPISNYEFSMLGNGPYCKSCYKELYHPKGDVSKQFIPTNRVGLIEYITHPFCGQRYYPSHEHDNTPHCYSCECMERRNE